MFLILIITLQSRDYKLMNAPLNTTFEEFKISIIYILLKNECYMNILNFFNIKYLNLITPKIFDIIPLIKLNYIITCLQLVNISKPPFNKVDFFKLNFCIFKKLKNN